jgi:hypothetical protein
MGLGLGKWLKNRVQDAKDLGSEAVGEVKSMGSAAVDEVGTVASEAEAGIVDTAHDAYTDVEKGVSAAAGVGEKAWNVASPYADDAYEYAKEELKSGEKAGEEALNDGKAALREGENLAKSGEQAVVDGGKAALQEGENLAKSGEQAVVDGGKAVLQEGEAAAKEGVTLAEDGVKAVAKDGAALEADAKEAAADGEKVPVLGNVINALSGAYHTGAGVYDATTGNRDGAVMQFGQAITNGIGMIPGANELIGEFDKGMGTVGVAAQMMLPQAADSIPASTADWVSDIGVMATNAMFGESKTKSTGNRRDEVGSGMATMLGGVPNLVAHDWLVKKFADADGALFGTAPDAAPTGQGQPNLWQQWGREMHDG